MMGDIHIPKPSYLLSQLAPRGKPEVTVYHVLAQLAELYQLGEVQACHRARRGTSHNYVVTTPRGKYVFRRHRLPEADVVYEHQVLEHLQQRGFPAPHMLVSPAGRAWYAIDGSLYSVYEYVKGYFPTDFVWWPAARRNILVRCGRTLGEFHRATTDLLPSAPKWNGYHAAGHKRWREGDWFRQALANIRSLLEKQTTTHPFDDWTRSRIDALEEMLKLEMAVEGRSDLSRLVIHGDYAPWNVLFRSGKPPFVLDFNESRLDLKIYDVVLATFWFAWRGGHLDRERALAFQAGYGQTNQLTESDVSLAASVFRWVMARSLTERLYKQYAGQRLWRSPAPSERQYQMCLFAERQPQQLVAGLKGAAAG